MKKRGRSKNTNTLLPVILIGVGVLLIIVVLALQLLQPSQPPAAPTSAANVPEPSVPRVTLEEAKQAFDEGSAVILDVRSAGSYEAGHIPGAINIPFDQIETRMAELDPNQWIITYCT